MPDLAAGIRPTAAETARLPWIDAAKGIGIVLVVLAHILRDGLVCDFICAFYMPLFFVLSGMVFRARRPREAWRTGLRRFFPAYIFYLITIGAVFQSYAVYKEFYPAHAMPWLAGRLLFDLVYGGQRLKGAMAVFWFIPVLFFCQWAYALITDRFPRAPTWVLLPALFTAAAACGIAVPLLPDGANPLDIGVVPIALVFYGAGVALARHRQSGRDILQDPRAIGLAIIIAGTGLVLAAIFPSSSVVDLKYGKLGIPGVSLCTAMALSFLAITICKAACELRKFRVPLTYLGRNSLTIMYIHSPLIFICAMANGIYPGIFSVWFVFLFAMSGALLWVRILDKSHTLRTLVAWK